MGAPMILVLNHSADWSVSFDQEAGRIRLALGDTATHLHHIGSTSIPHTKAKPVIDMLLETKSLAALDQKSSLLASLGYEVKGEFGIAGRRYFRKDDAMGIRTR
jgi:GrpB-like predicted nucleotidyltransferase (UPF0157 family)